MHPFMHLLAILLIRSWGDGQIPTVTVERQGTPLQVIGKMMEAYNGRADVN